MLVFSWQMGEELAAAHMRALGFQQVRRMPDGIDGGIDVTATDAVAQVKHHVATIGGPDVQRLRGAAPSTEHLLFYSSSGYSTAAIKAADLAKVSLFTYSTANDVQPSNAFARELLARVTGDTAEVAWAELLLARLRAAVYSQWFPKHLQEVNKRVQAVNSGQSIVSEKSAQELLNQVQSLMAVATDFDEVGLILVDASGLEAATSEDWGTVRAHAKVLSSAVRKIESQLIISEREARRLNQAQRTKLAGQPFDFLRTVSRDPEPFVATQITDAERAGGVTQ